MKQALGFGNKPGDDLKTMVERLMFSGDKAVPVFSDDTRFIMVMSAFTNYEKQVHTVMHTACECVL